MRITPGELEESGKILGKDLWVRAHSKDTPLKRFKRDVAPVELNDLNEIPISKELERMQSGNTNLRDILSTPEQFNSERWMIKRCTGIRKALEKKKKRGMLNTKA